MNNRFTRRDALTHVDDRMCNPRQVPLRHVFGLRRSNPATSPSNPPIPSSGTHRNYFSVSRHIHSEDSALIWDVGLTNRTTSSHMSPQE